MFTGVGSTKFEIIVDIGEGWSVGVRAGDYLKLAVFTTHVTTLTPGEGVRGGGGGRVTLSV